MILTGVKLDGHCLKPFLHYPIAPPNCARVFQREIQEQCQVQLGPILDGVAPHMESCHDTINFQPFTGNPVDVTQVLVDRGADILINYLPVGSEQATAYYAQAALDAGVAFLNCIPVFIASDPAREQKFINAGLHLVW